MGTARKSDSEEIQKFNLMVEAFAQTLQEMFRIYGNNIRSMKIDTNKSYMTKRININIRLDLDKAVV